MADLEGQKPESKIGAYPSLTYAIILIIHLHPHLRHVAQSPGEPVWQAIHDMVKNISEAMMSSLPTFWKISKSFMDGKLKKVYSVILPP
jgi:hypothetical protein